MKGYNVTLTMERVELVGNRAYSGGAVQVVQSNVTLRDCSFRGNRAESSGGAFRWVINGTHAWPGQREPLTDSDMDCLPVTLGEVPCVHRASPFFSERLYGCSTVHLPYSLMLPGCCIVCSGVDLGGYQGPGIHPPLFYILFSHSCTHPLGPLYFVSAGLSP